MQPEWSSAHEGQIAVFYQRHRTGLVTLVFTDLVDSTALMHQLGDQAGTTFLQQRRHIVRQTLKEFPDGEEIETAGDPANGLADTHGLPRTCRPVSSEFPGWPQ